ncbi:Cytoplasmic thioredoxin isoenzyme 2 [Puttea exsequens]|nr:Cytoplasmic thioredoxin isoenzyme 2 [Puttea exsequens]
MGVHNITSMQSYKEATAAPGVMVLDCFATWCGPCKVIAPKVAEFSNDDTLSANTNYYKVDVDEVPDVAQELGVRAMPTFFIFKDGEVVEQVVGANEKALKKAIEKVQGA